jgi:tetratricopeptide (TPR) repeat protein
VTAPRHIRLLLAAAVCAMLGAGLIDDAQAQRARAMREAVYERLSRAQEAADEGDFARAVDQLEKLEKMKDLSPGEKAQMYTAYGYLYFVQEKYDEAAASYERVLEQEDLTEAMRVSTLYTLGQLMFHLERYEPALGYIDRWLNEAENPGPEPYILKGQALYQLGRLGEAAAPVQQAIDIAKSRGQRVQENWYVLLRVIHFENSDFEALIDVLEILVTEYPAKEYWLHMAAASARWARRRSSSRSTSRPTNWAT